MFKRQVQTFHYDKEKALGYGSLFTKKLMAHGSLWLIVSHNPMPFMAPKLPKSLPYGLLGSPYGSLGTNQ
jgi:hypothetical protein